jgi:hypothetical protein
MVQKPVVHAALFFSSTRNFSGDHWRTGWDGSNLRVCVCAPFTDDTYPRPT